MANKPGTKKPSPKPGGAVKKAKAAPKSGGAAKKVAAKKPELPDDDLDLEDGPGRGSVRSEDWKPPR
jgi:hypothetical protein